MLFSLFRLSFGIFMIPQIVHLTPHVHDLGMSTFVFHYPNLHFIEAYSHELINLLEITALAGAIALALGLFTRLSALVFLLSFGYIFLIDRTFYNNHYYLWCLIAFLFVLESPKSGISIIDLFKRNWNKTVGLQVYLPFAVLISIVYFYGGLVKINPDWLQGYPMRLMLHAREVPNADFLAMLMSYGGILFDLFIWVFMFWRPKAWYVILPYFIFHTSNYFTFNIGEFPLVMMAAYMLFIPFGQHSVITLIKNLWVNKTLQLTTALYICFFSFQLLYPLRTYLIPGNSAWHRQGYYFSWRMMLNNHEVYDFQFKVVMPDKQLEYAVDFGKLLTFRQYSNTYHDPYHIWSLAQKLKKDAELKYQSKDVRVYCSSMITLNQHPAQLLINDTMNLAGIPYHLYSNNPFINKFKN